MSVINQLDDLALPRSEFIVIGSGLLDALGIRTANDLDLLVSGDLYEQLKADGWTEAEKDGNKYLHKDEVELWQRWGSKNFDELIGQVVVIEGYNFITIEELMRWKATKGRPKDLNDIKLIQQYLSSRNS